MEPERTRIAQPLPCLKCGYDLRTLKLSDRCPECGEACENSLHHLALVEVASLQRLRSGALLAALAILVVPVVYLSIAVFAMLMWRAGGSEQALVILGLTVVAGPIMAAVGWRRLCESPPAVFGVAAPAAPLRPSWAVRWGVMYAVCFSLAVFVVAVGILSRRSGGWLNPAGNFLAVTAIGSLWMLRTFVGFKALLSLAERAGARRTKRSMVLCKWGVLVAYGCFAVGYAAYNTVDWLAAAYIYGVSEAATAWIWRLIYSVSQFVMMVGILLTVAACAGIFVIMIALRAAIGRELRLARSWVGPPLTADPAATSMDASTGEEPSHRAAIAIIGSSPPPDPASPPAV